MRLKLGILGYGKMGAAIAEGLLSQKFDCELHAFDKQAVIPPEIKIARNETDLLSKVEMLILCVKPQDVAAMLASISQEFRSLKSPPLIVSIAAGIKLSYYESQLGASAKIARIMPNLAATAGESASCICANEIIREKDLQQIQRIFGCIGKTFLVPEERMDAVTAVSGSGPAYFFMLAEALADAGEEAGLETKLAMQLAIQTLVGSGELLKKTGETPAELMERITSPNGTTAAALKIFEEGGFKQVVGRAVAAAKARSEELSKT